LPMFRPRLGSVLFPYMALPLEVSKSGT